VRKSIIALKWLIFIGLSGCCGSSALAQGTVILPLSNVTATCINASNHTIDFWLLSARVPKKQTWITDTNGVGARVDIKISGNGTQVSFPAAAAINTADINGKIIRASLRLHVLADQDLWNTTNAAALIKTTNISTPVTYMRRQGSSDTVKVMQTLISFTNTVGAAIPANPYVQGAEMAGKLANSLLSVFQPDPNEVVDPNFSLSFGVSRSDTVCQPTDLQQGVGAEIADSDVGGEAAGIIQTAQLSNFCFYVVGANADPNIGFSRRVAATCATAVPNDVQTLNNPQFIWMAFGTCKDGATCPSNPALSPNVIANTTNQVSTLGRTNNEFTASLSKRVGSKAVNKIMKSQVNLSRPTQADNRAATAVAGLALCKSVGISLEQCMTKRLAH
jgi:hypothetical protein